MSNTTNEGLGNLLDTIEIMQFSRVVDRIYEELFPRIEELIDMYVKYYRIFNGRINNAWQDDKTGRYRSDFYTVDNREKLRLLVCSLLFLNDYVNGELWEDDIEQVGRSMRLFREYDIVEKFKSIAGRKHIWYGSYEFEF